MSPFDNATKKILSQTALKAAMFVYPFDGYWYCFSFGSKYNVFWGCVFLFSLAGMYFSKREIPEVQLLFWTMLSFLITIVVFEGIPRYRLPLEPVFILFAISWLIHFYRHRPSWITGIFGINILMWLVFRYYDFHDLLSWDKIKDLL